MTTTNTTPCPHANTKKSVLGSFTIHLSTRLPATACGAACPVSMPRPALSARLSRTDTSSDWGEGGGGRVFGLEDKSSTYHMFSAGKRKIPSERATQRASKTCVAKKKKTCAARKKKEEVISAEVRAMVSQWKSREGGAHLCSNIRR